MTNSTFSGNVAAASGGGIYSTSGSKVEVVNTTFSENSSGIRGGGIMSWGTLTVANSTFSGNSTDHFGGGIHNVGGGREPNDGTLEVTNSTFSNNSANGDGAGIFSNSGKGTLRNTIVANNTLGGKNCSGNGMPTDGGYNIDDGTSCGFSTSKNSRSGVDPMLGPLADNGGPTQTIALQPTSPAVNAIPFVTNGCGIAITKDQRGVRRPQGTACDVGAFELEQASPPTPDKHKKKHHKKKHHKKNKGGGGGISQGSSQGSSQG